MTLREFPNKMGADVTSGPARFEMFYPDPAIGVLTYSAKHVDSDGYGTHWRDGFVAESHESAAQLIIADWKEKRAQWQTCHA